MFLITFLLLDQIIDYVENCHCLNNCINTQFNLQKYNSISWFRGTTINWELYDPKIQLKRDVIYGLGDLFGK